MSRFATLLGKPPALLFFFPLSPPERPRPGLLPPRFTDRYIALAVRTYKDKVEELAKVLRTTEDEAARIADDWSFAAAVELRQELPDYFVSLNSLVVRERREIES